MAVLTATDYGCCRFFLKYASTFSNDRHRKGDPPASAARVGSAAPDAKPPVHTYTVAPRDTLDRIAGIAGARSRSDRHRMMIAIYRANPAAFQANVNVLHSGAILHLPTVEQLSAISAEDADREYDAQMTAWRASDRRVLPAAPAPVAVAPNSTVDAKPDAASLEMDRSVLTQRVESLEKSLHELKQELKQPPGQTTTSEAADSAPAANTTANQPYLENERVPPSRNRIPFAPLAIGAGLLLAASAWLLRRRGNRDNFPAAPDVEQNSSLTRDTKEDQSVEAGESTPPVPQPAGGASLAVEQTFSFLNPESHANTTHLVMGSGLNEPSPFVERRKNPAAVLRQAIEREPHRSDLRLKLLELYYTAAAENRRAFLEATRQLAKNEKLVSAEDWSRIADMGRAIAPDDGLFSDTLEDKEVA